MRKRKALLTKEFILITAIGKMRHTTRMTSTE
jgi:hypothetical protein